MDVKRAEISPAVSRCIHILTANQVSLGASLMAVEVFINYRGHKQVSGKGLLRKGITLYQLLFSTYADYVSMTIKTRKHRWKRKVSKQNNNITGK